MAMTPAQMVEAVTRNLEKNTGKTAAQWSALLKKAGPKEAKAQYEWLRKKHHLGHVAARILSGQLKAYDEPDKLVDAQYAGKRAPLRPLYDAIVRAAKTLGKDVSVHPCKTYVPIHRKKTFAIVKPAAGRVDVTLVERAGRTTLAVRTKRDLGAAFLRRLKTAYDQSV